MRTRNFRTRFGELNLVVDGEGGARWWRFMSRWIGAARAPGFRMSAIDVCVIAVAAVAGWYLRDTLGDMAWVIPMTVGHFFLFCNVFRLRRSYELLWAGIFLANVMAWKWGGLYSWWTALALQMPVTVLLIVAEVRSPSYHGIWSRAARARHNEPGLENGSN
jgi:hypothetical protein